MPKFRKKPIVIEAEQWFPEQPHDSDALGTYRWPSGVYGEADITSVNNKARFYINTLEGRHEVTPGDFIITGVKGEKYPCKPDIFKMTYEAVGEDSPRRPAVAVDFDGVIHRYSKGWQDGTCYDIPMEGAEAGLKKLMEKYNVFIFTARDTKQVLEWMQKNINITCEIATPDIPFWTKSNVIGITNQKLAAIAYIDDRAVQFSSWDRINNPDLVKTKE